MVAEGGVVALAKAQAVDNASRKPSPEFGSLGKHVKQSFTVAFRTCFGIEWCFSFSSRSIARESHPAVQCLPSSTVTWDP